LLPDSSVSELVRPLALINLARAQRLFDDKRSATRTDSGKWEELVYCILAGSQVPIEKAHAAQESLFDCAVGFDTSILGITTSPSEPLIAERLRLVGYRYHHTKAATITAAARFFATGYHGSPELFLSSGDPNHLRRALVSDIRGIGIKIASHWLRNVGLPIATIDIHIRRFVNACVLRQTTVVGDKTKLTTSEFFEYEDILRSIADFLELPLPVFQYSIWLFAREHCSKSSCGGCLCANYCVRYRAT
jgi:N-glycosylase/DNA lyase